MAQHDKREGGEGGEGEVGQESIQEGSGSGGASAGNGASLCSTPAAALPASRS